MLTFTSDPLEADLEMIGPVRVRVHAQSSIPHVDLFARLCDVTPRGRSINITDGIVRLTEATADTVQAVDIELWPLAHTFRLGHRIRLQVSGGAHPRYGRNPGTGQPLATGTTLKASDRTIHHDTGHPSPSGYPHAVDPRITRRANGPACRPQFLRWAAARRADRPGSVPAAAG